MPRQPSTHAFSLALHAEVAAQLTRLLLDDEAFERFWQRPRRTGLWIALKTLGLAGLATVNPPLRQVLRTSPATPGSSRPGW